MPIPSNGGVECGRLVRNHLSSLTVEPEAFQKAVGGGRPLLTENCKLSRQIDRGWGCTVDNKGPGKSGANRRGCKVNRQSDRGILDQTLPPLPRAHIPRVHSPGTLC